MASSSMCDICLRSEGKVSFRGVFTDICTTKDNRIILCKSSDLLVLTEQGQHLQTIKLVSDTFGIAIQPDSDEAWATLPSRNKVQIVNTRSYVPTDQLTVSRKGYYGIAFKGDNIALGTKGQVDVINKNGVVLKSLKVGNGNLYSLCAARGDTNKLYCCETDESRFRCINMDGSTVFTVSFLKRPIGVITDSHGNLYVFDYLRNELHRFSDDGNPKGVILTEKDGLNSPFSGAFNYSFSKMFVPNYFDGNLHIYSCT